MHVIKWTSISNRHNFNSGCKLVARYYDLALFVFWFCDPFFKTRKENLSSSPSSETTFHYDRTSVSLRYYGGRLHQNHNITQDLGTFGTVVDWLRFRIADFVAFGFPGELEEKNLNIDFLLLRKLFFIKFLQVLLQIFQLKFKQPYNRYQPVLPQSITSILLSFQSQSIVQKESRGGFKFHFQGFWQLLHRLCANTPMPITEGAA